MIKHITLIYFNSLSGIIYNYENINNNNVNIINSEIITLSSTIYNNYNNTIATQNNIYNYAYSISGYAYSISGNVNKLQNNIYTYAYSISSNIYTNYVSNSNLNTTTTNLQNQINNFSPINLQYGINIIPSSETYNAQGGKGIVTRSTYIRFNYGREWCISNQDDAGVLSQDNLYFRCGAGGQDAIKFTLGPSSITTPLPFNGVSALQMSYLTTITSNIQNQIYNCVHFTDL